MFWKELKAQNLLLRLSYILRVLLFLASTEVENKEEEEGRKKFEKNRLYNIF
jgi:hypothetical protein